MSDPWECFLPVLGDLGGAIEVDDGESFLLVMELILRKLRLNSLPFRMNLEVNGACVSSFSSSEEGWSTRRSGASLLLVSLADVTGIVVSPVTEVGI